MEYLPGLIGLISAVVFLIAFPVLTLVLMRRAGIRGVTLALAAIPGLILGAAGVAFPLMLVWGVETDFLVQIASVKAICDGIGAISPLVILAMLKWPVLDNADSRVETFQ
jgi:hypothetical protein